MKRRGLKDKQIKNLINKWLYETNPFVTREVNEMKNKYKNKNQKNYTIATNCISETDYLCYRYKGVFFLFMV